MGYRIAAIVGARPNYMKVAPIWRELENLPHVERVLIHTGQHYDENMSKVFFDDLRLPRPDEYLGVGSAPHGVQTGRVMIELERVLSTMRPDLLVVVGDVNSTMAGALVAVKQGISVAHVEAGLRSFDRTMPEEINRLVTDAVSDLLFITEPSGERNLKNEGIPQEKIHFVGNVMIDSLLYYRPLAERSSILSDTGLEDGRYGLVTLHRPSNVDDPDSLRRLLHELSVLGVECPLVFPVHPRTRKIMTSSGLQDSSGRVRLLDPVGYLDFVKLLAHARVVLTDSGGIQEETTALGIPCLTIRKNTERPVTIELGTNRLVDVDSLVREGRRVLSSGNVAARIPDLWDGDAAKRIVEVIDAYCS